MVHALPPTVTIREALHQYLESKGITVSHQADEGIIPTKVTTLGIDPDTAVQEANANANTEDPVPSSSSATSMLVETTSNTNDSNRNDDRHTTGENDDNQKSWLDMVDGVILLFDQALPFRLLYPQEMPQHMALEGMEEWNQRPKCDLYGCERLLRLFLQLPSMLLSSATTNSPGKVGNDPQTTVAIPDEELRSIFAKVNDLIRFLHKHQSTLFGQSYRKYTDTERRIALQQVKNRERKRKRILEEMAAAQKRSKSEYADDNDEEETESE